MEIQARPEYVAVLPPKRVLAISPSGFLMDATKPYHAFARLRAVELLATTWQIYTPDQLQELAAGSQNNT